MDPISYNTYDTYDLLHYTLLPYGFTIGLSFKDYSTGQILKNVALGKTGDGAPAVRPIDHSLSGDYVRYALRRGALHLEITCASQGERAAVRIRPLSQALRPVQISAYACFLWNTEGSCRKQGDKLIAESGKKSWKLFASGQKAEDLNTDVPHPQLLRLADGPVYVYTEEVDDPEAFIEQKNNQRRLFFASKPEYGQSPELYRAMQAAIAWNTFYEPNGKRVITGVSRDWNVYNGGYALFCWDCFFSALLCAEFSQRLAEDNFFAMLREQGDLPFVPNSSSGSGFRTLDRSQPPVGSMVALKIYHKYRDEKFLKKAYPHLKRWNEWFWQNRQAEKGLFAWGSAPYDPVVGNEWETNGVGNVFGASLESGMDNSPLYRGAGWNSRKNLMDMIDVGLSALFLHDCACLRDMAKLLGEKGDAAFFEERKQVCEEAFFSLWCEEDGMFLNRVPHTQIFHKTRSAVHFYAFYHEHLQQKHVDGLLAKFFDEKEFYGEYMIASVSKSDPDYKRQNYWQGRIWPPLNYLVHDALKGYEACARARAVLAEKSEKLLLGEWRKYGHVHENYNAETGSGCEIPPDNRIPGSSATFGSDCMYNWGGLLALLALEESRNTK